MKLFNIKNLVARFRNDEEGATLVEYAIALLIAVGVGTVIVNGLAVSTKTNFQNANKCLNSTAADGTC